MIHQYIKSPDGDADVGADTVPPSGDGVGKFAAAGCSGHVEGATRPTSERSVKSAIVQSALHSAKNSPNKSSPHMYDKSPITLATV